MKVTYTTTEVKRFYTATPEQVVMLQIAAYMKQDKKRSFSSYLKSCGTDRIERVSISVKEIAEILNISIREADSLVRNWRDEIGGKFVQAADLYCYYFKEKIEVFA